eukprot:5310104-Prymnesium_polylepis.1
MSRRSNEAEKEGGGGERDWQCAQPSHIGSSHAMHWWCGQPAATDAQARASMTDFMSLQSCFCVGPVSCTDG